MTSPAASSTLWAATSGAPRPSGPCASPHLHPCTQEVPMVYHQLGEIPSKRHKIYRKPSGELYTEELVGNMGFVGPSSLLYHVRRPTAVRALHTVKELK